MKHPIGIRMHDLGNCTPPQLAQKLAGYGLHCGQLAIPKSIAGIGSYHDVDESLLKGIQQALGAEGISIGVLGCYIEPVHPDAQQRSHHLGNFAEGIRCAAALNAGCIGTETPPTGRNPKSPQTYADLCRSTESMLEKANLYGVTVALEPVRYDVLNTPETVYKFLQQYKGENIGIIFDALNLLYPSMLQRQEEFWNKCLDAFGNAVVALHIKDAVPNADASDWAECSLGQGVFRYDVIREWLQKQPVEIPVLREGFQICHSAEELVFLEKLAQE